MRHTVNRKMESVFESTLPFRIGPPRPNELRVEVVLHPYRRHVVDIFQLRVIALFSGLPSNFMATVRGTSAFILYGPFGDHGERAGISLSRLFAQTCSYQHLEPL